MVWVFAVRWVMSVQIEEVVLAVVGDIQSRLRDHGDCSGWIEVLLSRPTLEHLDRNQSVALVSPALDVVDSCCECWVHSCQTPARPSVVHSTSQHWHSSHRWPCHVSCQLLSALPTAIWCPVEACPVSVASVVWAKQQDGAAVLVAVCWCCSCSATLETAPSDHAPGLFSAPCLLEDEGSW